MSTGIVSSLLESDLYKFTMWQAFLHQFPGATARYVFKCRSQTAFPLADLLDDVNREIDLLCQLQYSDDELAYLAGLRFIKPDFVDFLALFRFRRKFIQISTAGEDLVVESRGPIIYAMPWEIHVLSIINECYFRRLPSNLDGVDLFEDAKQRLNAKIERLADDPDLAQMTLFDFGLRRRYSGPWQEQVARQLIQRLPGIFAGSSNVYLAKKLGIKPIGTMAHEWLQAHQSLGYPLIDSQKAALENWVKEYRGDLAIALTDVIGMDAFLKDFDLYFSKLYDGGRHDSGDPIAWGEKLIRHYQALGIDPATKSAVFSDGLTVEKAIELHKHFHGRIKTSFGIGTSLMNDTLHKPLNIVMKIVECNGQPVAKISDSGGKTMCSNELFVSQLRTAFTSAQVAC